MYQIVTWPHLCPEDFLMLSGDGYTYAEDTQARKYLYMVVRRAGIKFSGIWLNRKVDSACAFQVPWLEHFSRSYMQCTYLTRSA